MTDEIILQTKNLGKQYKRRWAVHHLDLEVHRGDVFGFLGPNGAGKEHHDPDAPFSDPAHRRRGLRLRERRKAQQAELKRVTSPAGFGDPEAERELVLLPLADPR